MYDNNLEFILPKSVIDMTERPLILIQNYRTFELTLHVFTVLDKCKPKRINHLVMFYPKTRPLV